MQEAYWPWCIKYSICYPVWGGVAPHQGTPGQVQEGYPRWDTPHWGTSWPGPTVWVPEVECPPTGVHPGQVWWKVPKVGYLPSGYPQPGPTGGWGYPRWSTPIRVSSPPGLIGGTWGGVPHPGQVQWGYPRWGTPHQGTPLPGLTGGPKVGYPLAGVPGWGTLPPGPGWSTPPRCGQTEWWTDTCQNITFPSYYVRGR